MLSKDDKAWIQRELVAFQEVVHAIVTRRISESWSKCPIGRNFRDSKAYIRGVVFGLGFSASLLGIVAGVVLAKVFGG